VMRIVGKHVARAEPVANQWPRIVLLAECDVFLKMREIRIFIVEIIRIETRDVVMQ
jgi:hypothetical protein